MAPRAADRLLRNRFVVGGFVVASCSAGCAKDKPGATPDDRDPKLQSASLVSSLAASSPSRGSACGPRGLPPDRHFVAEGLCVRVVSHKQGPLRGLTFAPNGDLLAVTAAGEIRRYRDADHDGLFDESAPETIVWAKTGGDNGQNCELDGPDLYCGSKAGVKRWRYAPELDRGGPGEDVIVGMPDSGLHRNHPLGVWDGFVYAASGSADNSMDPMPPDFDTNRSVVKRFPLEKYAPARPFQWKEGEVVVRGARNVTAMGRDPRSGRLIGIDKTITDAARRGVDVHDDNPGEAIISLEPGTQYGFPFCFFAQRIVENGVVLPPGTPLASEIKRGTPVLKELARSFKSTRDDAWCAANVHRPLGLVQAHSSALGMTFPLPAGRFALAERWRRGAFVALHGSSNREPSTGHKVIWIPFGDDGTPPMPTSTKEGTSFPYEVVFGGGKYGAPRDGEWSWKLGDAGEDPVRPVGVAISPLDGALYVSSDNASGAMSARSGSIYRIALLGK